MQQLNTVKEILHEVTQRMERALEVTRREFQNLRTGRASIHLVEGIPVQCYGATTPLKGLAQISTPDARQILIQPWDPSVLPDIERALQTSELGITPQNDGKVIRLQVPALTEERRLELTKVIKKIAEEGRVSIRNARHEGNEQTKRLEREKRITQDDSMKAQKEIQRLTDKCIASVDEAVAKKEQEIREI